MLGGFWGLSAPVHGQKADNLRLRGKMEVLGALYKWLS